MNIVKRGRCRRTCDSETTWNIERDWNVQCLGKQSGDTENAPRNITDFFDEYQHRKPNFAGLAFIDPKSKLDLDANFFVGLPLRSMLVIPQNI